MASVKAILYRSKKKADGTHPIALRIIKDRKPAYLYLDWIGNKYWDDTKSKVKSSHLSHKRLNNLILKKLTQADDLILEFESNNRFYTGASILKLVKGNRKNISFFKYAEEYIEELEKTNKHSRASSDKARIKRTKEFTNNRDIAFQEIDQAFLKKLRVFLIAKHQSSERSVLNTYVVIRTIFNKAISEGIVDQKYYPFGKGKIQIKFPQTLKIGLSEDEITAIENLELKTGTTIWHSRNIFLFSFYLAGMRISDVLKIKWEAIQNDRLYYKMNKNSKADSVKLTSKILSLLSHYQKDKRSNTDFIFPELKKANLKDSKDVYNKTKTATKKFNKYLNELAQLAEIDKKITCHIARHSFGNIAGDKISPQMLQKLYRHSNLSTTIGYQGNFIHKNADEALDSVLNF
ncbi:site-specific integrase [Aquimarina mytili]|uniref:Site-specific integrase n=1 Tax=Aquimarina mytili TaxID=874423 RepID=A0A936ZXT3_9FLAO|nr:site-specific integrase [Aquimarina mytili]MBL0683880.1 site-specific integrase [Aquimarina mytili]